MNLIKNCFSGYSYLEAAVMFIVALILAILGACWLGEYANNHGGGNKVKVVFGMLCNDTECDSAVRVEGGIYPNFTEEIDKLIKNEAHRFYWVCIDSLGGMLRSQ